MGPVARLRFVIVVAGEATGETAPGSGPAAGSEQADQAGAPQPLDRTERRRLDVVRRFGTTGSLLLAVGAIGAGAAPVDNPLSGVRLIGLPARMPTVAMACAWLGMLMIVMAWVWLGRLSWPGSNRLVSVTQLARTVAMWALPLALAPPLFSRDMYAYLAQSEIAHRGLDPYVLSPLTALGVDHPLTSNVNNIWRDTPAPYGPLFLMFGRVISSIVGDNVILGVLLWRVVMLSGLALAIWAIPRLARRCGVHPVSALWLSAANPIVLFHVVSGMHNEALMVGIMLAAIELGLRWKRVLGVVVAGVLLTVGGAIKPPGFIALGFFGVYVARRWGGRYADLFKAAALLTAVFLVTMTVVTVSSGWGLGWIETYDVPNRLKTWLAPMSAIGMTGGGVSMLLGLGNHTDALLVITKILGYGVAATVCLRMLWLSFRGRIEPLAGLGITFGALALFGPVVHPWYLLWALVPLALSTNDNRFRIAAAVISLPLALFVPPTGSGFELRIYQIPLAVAAALVIFGLLVWLVRGRVPWPGPTRGGVRRVTA
ncbi:polyprenol phosphomannose-dependent alpha 1,6 mannosyltransferase MptB [Saccharopolyspora erythraea]|uniref:polyprenol phosphomannose-dependent alpha 1,6 mannosyltransferase MptB n=1 Tax=Saccharopolyspora erythraea TaxID=1836 RepID=UPI001BAD2CED|nr:polyprenol phosphomannose-dependent alpha 1,6 mannosyltransferase MptB [Saccharopolyspora erythraea]QUH01692.1 polyprenol phosphomannose-dependent alpha 1,6 mannosyltransferase MptB [Saccharopolyspora erythraea]